MGSSPPLKGSRFPAPLPCFLALFPDSFLFLNKQLLRSSLYVHLCCSFQGHISASFLHVKQTASLLLSLASHGCLKQRRGWRSPPRGPVCVCRRGHPHMHTCTCIFRNSRVSVHAGSHVWVCTYGYPHVCTCTCVCMRRPMYAPTPKHDSLAPAQTSLIRPSFPCPQSIKLLGGNKMCLGKRKESMPDSVLFILKPNILRCAFSLRGEKILKSNKQTRWGRDILGLWIRKLNIARMLIYSQINLYI